MASVQQPAAATDNLEPGTWNLEPGTCNLEPAICPPCPPGARLSAAETSAHRPRAFVTPIKNGGFGFYSIAKSKLQ
ncbi:hypothetical protein ED312_09310 [Sinomicrobium pectinilyticum]|uniref:Uncharacterized protein n=1 Tax=Sinomicrobium pectinilyticum TaxID=1084421 RepID=A0A3N0EJ43_SINP1|nr:hypothetical protein ED312_09310 [Sinomicrobium pectinilyticum]